MMRRNVNLAYIIENNGVYGLTKGQFSATADEGSVMKGGKLNDMPAIDLCELAITLGATYVARSFSGDRKQLAPLIQGAVAHKGSAILDVLSPCVTFNNHEGSTKSLKYIKEHLDPLHDIDFIPHFENIEVDYKKGTDHEVILHDGSRITLHKLGDNYDPTSRQQALMAIHAAVAEGKFLTGLIYYNPDRVEFAEGMNLCETPLAELGQDVLQPSQEQLDEINARLMR
jgi:2-oxoglutarate ferredoxin oxidoreductase subunit beta